MPVDYARPVAAYVSRYEPPTDESWSIDSPLLKASMDEAINDAWDAIRPQRIRTMREFAEQEIILPEGPFAKTKFHCSRQPFTASTRQSSGMYAAGSASAEEAGAGSGGASAPRRPAV